MKCHACGGCGDDTSYDAAGYYAEFGIIPPCPECDGTGTAPQDRGTSEDGVSSSSRTQHGGAA